MDPLVDRIYEASVTPESWPGILHDISKSVGAFGGGMFTRRSDLWTGGRYSRHVSGTIEAYLKSDAARLSQTTPRLVRANRNDFVTDDELFTEEEYRADSYVTEWAAPNAMH